jgi:hypothetical protein
VTIRVGQARFGDLTPRGALFLRGGRRREAVPPVPFSRGSSEGAATLVRNPLEQDPDAAAGGAAYSNTSVAGGAAVKYADMQKQLDSGRFEKRPRNTTKPAYKPPHRQELDFTQTPDLLTELEAETWLAERLKAHGCDIYAGGPYASYADRLGAAIVRNGLACVIVGRGKDGKPESYAQLFQRIAGKALPKKITDGPTQHQKATP